MCNKLNKSCETCEFNFGEVCACHDSMGGYGWKIDDFQVQRDCWKIGQEYFNHIIERLPEEIKMDFLHNPRTKIDEELIFRYFEKDV